MNKICFAIYDWPCDLDSFKLASALKERMDKLGIKILVCSILYEGNNKPKRISECAMNNLLGAGSERDIYSVEIFYGSQSTVNDHTRDWHGYISVSLTNKVKKTAIFCAPSILIPDGGLGLINSVSSLGALSYGIGFHWSKETDPSYHIYGLTLGFPETEAQQIDAERDQIWFEERIGFGGRPAKMRHRIGLFRDVYEINILNHLHLERVLGGVSFADRVLCSDSWGTIDPLGNGNWLWRISSDLIPEVRSSLVEAGCVIGSSD